MRRRLACLLALVLAVGSPAPAAAYLKYGVEVNGRAVDIGWGPGPIRYFVTERGGPGVTADELAAAVDRAFQTWGAVETATVTPAFQGFTVAPPGAADGRSTLGFLDRPDLDRVLGATSFLLDTATGAIIEADVFFNTRFDWSTADAGVPGRVDLQSVALHEIGHLLGLGHSAIGETELLPSGGRRVIASGAVMFPVAFAAGSTANRVLTPDDIAGVSDLYPAAGFLDRSGSVSGRVTLDGAGVFGAHVLALDVRTGAVVGGFTLNDRGEFVVAGLEPGPHILRVEPLDDADTEGFFTGPVETGFAVAYGPGLVVAPRGGTSDRVEIKVSRR
ncbi:MAG: matrixin family metalloprotease [Vicinamibacterales bacterium]